MTGIEKKKNFIISVLYGAIVLTLFYAFFKYAFGLFLPFIVAVLVAMILLKTTVVISYLPWLMLCSIICGIVIALMCAIILPQFEKILINKNRC